MISKAINAKVQVQGQSGLFSFSKLFLNSPNIQLCVSNSNVNINILGIFSNKRKLLNINISKMKLKVKNLSQKNIESKEKNESNANIKNDANDQLSISPFLDNFSNFQHSNFQIKPNENYRETIGQSQKIFQRIVLLIFFYLFRFFEVSIEKVEIIQEKIEAEANDQDDNFEQFVSDFTNDNPAQAQANSVLFQTSLKLSYERSELLKLTAEIGQSSLNIKNSMQLKCDQFSISTIVELSAVFDFMTMSKQMILSKSHFEHLEFEINKSMFEIKPVSISLNFFPGNCFLSLTSFKLYLPYEFPQFIVTLKNIGFSTQIPLKNLIEFHQAKKIAEKVDQTDGDSDQKKKKKKKKETSKSSSQITSSGNRLKIVEVAVEDFNVKIVSEHFLQLQKVILTVNDFRQLDCQLNVSTFFFHYSSLDGLKIFPVYKMLRDPNYTPPRIVFDFPMKFKANIKDFTAKLHLTDKARVRATSSNVKYRNGAFEFPLVKLKINKIQMAKVHNFSISSPDKTFFTFSADYVVAHDRKKFPIGEFIMNIVYAWRIIKPWASKKQYDTETLPFPIAIHIKKVCAKFHDNPVNIKLATLATSAIPSFLQERIVMQEIFNRKVSDLNFSENQSKNAVQRLSELYFNTYQKIVKKQKFHKYILKMTVTEVHAFLDSRNVAPGMENLIHKFDPTTAELHPNVKWETLEGLKIDLKVGSYVAEMMNLTRPFMEGYTATLKGTLIVGEIQDNRPIDVFTNVYDQPFNAPGYSTDVKLYCDLSATAESFKFSFAGPANKLMDDFADTIISCIPEAGLDPSPPLRWWDMLRNIFRGRYSANVGHVMVNAIGGTDVFDLENALCLNAYDGRLQITEGNFMLNTECLDILRKRNGPMICHFPKFSMDYSINWKTRGGANPRSHLIIPNVDLFGVEGYDTYHDFRATEYTFAFVINFTNDQISPFITLDVAHLSWIIDPLLNLGGVNFLNECYERKCGVDSSRKDNMPEVYFFGDLPCTINIKMNTTPTFSLRIFDHFPVVNDNEQEKKRAINGTSIDVTLQNFTLDCCLQIIKEFTINCSIFSDAVLFNATDLRIYSKFSKELPTTFMVFTRVIFKYIKQKMSIGVSNIRIIANQFNAKYLKEYFEAFFHFLPGFSSSSDNETASNQGKEETKRERTMPRKAKKSVLNKDGDLLTHLLRRRSSQKTITAQKGRENCVINQTNNSFIDKFSTPLISLEVPKVEILVESLQYDARLYASLDKVILSINKDESKDLLLVQLLIDSLSFQENKTFTNKVEIENFDIISTNSAWNLSSMNAASTTSNEETDEKESSNSQILLKSLSPPSEKKKKRKSKKKSNKNDQDLISIENIKFQYYQTITIILKENHYEASISSLKLNACSNDIALIKQFAQEIIPTSTGNKSYEKEKDKEKDINKIITENANNNNNNGNDSSVNINSNIIDVSNYGTNVSPSYIDFGISEFDAIIYDSNIVPIGSLVATDLIFKSDKKTNNISESSILVQDLSINDIRPGEVNPIVVQRWMSMVEGKTKNPLIRFQCKIPPPVGGITVINHLEMNIDPTIVNYEAAFFSVLIQFILSKAVKASPFFQVSYEFPKTNLCLPNVLLPQNVLPSMEEDTSKYMEENKSTEIKLMTEKGEEYFLLRYFKITQTKLNVSYHNPESKIPDINEFNGLFHEIKYQDFNCSINTLIEKLISDISSDMIPQFLKHVIGLNKFQENEENSLNESTSTDQMKQSSKQKMMLFGKKKQNK